MLIGGAWVESESGARFDAESPASGEVIGTVPEGTREDARRAIEAANDASAGWAALSAFERAAGLERVAAEIESRRETLARTLTLDQGKPLVAEAYDEVDELVGYFRQAAAEATRLEGSLPPSLDAAKRVLVYRVPRGVVGVITPWNWPYTMPAEIIAPALAAGNAVVWAAAPSTSLCAVALAECVADAGIPAGVLNLVTGPGPVVGDEIAASPGTHAVAFIGSIETGHRVAERAAGKALLLEMGGNGPFVVLDDADVDAAAPREPARRVPLRGAELYRRRALPRARARARRVRRGALGRDRARDPPRRPLRRRDDDGAAEQRSGEPRRWIGTSPMLSSAGRRSCSAAARASGYPTELFYHATVISEVTGEMEIAREETFGPVVPITRIGSDEEALAIANASPYGLLAAVWTRDLARGLRFAEQIRAGWVNVNESTNYWESHLPFGGRSGSRSGVGRVGGRHPLDVFTEPKTVVVSLD